MTVKHYHRFQPASLNLTLKVGLQAVLLLLLFVVNPGRNSNTTALQYNSNQRNLKAVQRNDIQIDHYEIK